MTVRVESELVIWRCPECGYTPEPGDALPSGCELEPTPVIEASEVEGLVEIGNRLSGYSQVQQDESAEARREWREAVERLGL